MHSLIKKTIRHASYAVSGAALGAALTLLIGSKNFIQAISLSTAYASFLYVGAALLIGPLKVLAGGNPVLSIRLRRNFGIWSGVFAIAHVFAGLNVHFSGRLWLYFIFPAETDSFFPLRYDPFGLTNYTGVAAAVVIVILLWLSNDGAIRKLGPQRWKNIQRLAYPLFALVVAHGLIYQLLENRIIFFIIILISLFLLVTAYQVRGYRKQNQILLSRKINT
jgi:sulfoxide reductase heme-binding subunit YedZ